MKAKPNLQPGDLVFDIGCHNGDDSMRFLDAGFRVIALDASRRMLEIMTGRLQHPWLHVIHAAISREREQVTFFQNASCTVWSSTDEQIAKRNPAHEVETITVPATNLRKMIEAHGVPQYIKLDIEGAEIDALMTLPCPVFLLSLEIGHARIHPVEVLGLAKARGFTHFAYCRQTRNVTEGWDRALDWSPIDDTESAMPPCQWADLFLLTQP